MAPRSEISAQDALDATTNFGTNQASEVDGAAAAAALGTSNSGISADEIALYDRQIRLWGVKAQERIRSAKVLLVSVKGLGTEVAKNLILNGIGSLTIVDDGVVGDEDLGAQYFLREEDLGFNRAQAAVPRLQELNPRVRVTSDISDINSKNAEFYTTFDLIVATDLPFIALSMINAAARFSERPFFAAGIHGLYGFVFADLLEHEYIIEREISNVATKAKSESLTRSIVNVASKKENGKNIELVTKTEKYSPLLLANTSPLPEEYLRSRRRLKSVNPLLPALRALWQFERSYARYPSHAREDLVAFTQMANQVVQELQLPPETLKSDFLRSFLQNVGSEIVPTAAFVGGRLAEDIVNVLGKREQPIQNTLLFDGENFQAPIYALHPFIDAPSLIGNGPSAQVTVHTASGSNGYQQLANGSTTQTGEFSNGELQPQQLGDAPDQNIASTTVGLDANAGAMAETPIQSAGTDDVTTA